MSGRYLLGVLGGMGPIATLDFLQKVICATPADRDQDHVPVVTWNVPQIPDRQLALAARGISPLPAMRKGIRQLIRAGATHIAIPCNTAHVWHGALQSASTAPVLHIIDTALAALPTGPVRLGVIGTRGLLGAGLYQQRLAARGVDYLLPDDDELDCLFTPGCYAVKRGDMALGGTLLTECASRLLQRGASHLLLGCTEVPLALAATHPEWTEISIDPAAELAKHCVRDWQTTHHLEIAA